MIIRYSKDLFADACTRACNEFAAGNDCAVYVDSCGMYWILDVDGLKYMVIIRTAYDPAKGVPIATDTYRGPDRRQPQPAPQPCTGDRIWGFMQKILAPEYHGEDV